VAEGTPLHFPDHPFGPHPWSFTDRWLDTDVLQLHRPGDRYSVWGFFLSGVRSGWYVNFQRPLERWPGGVDTLDHGVDIVVAADGRRQWKDRDHVAEQVATGRLTAADADSVWRETGRVAALLDRGPGSWWWSGWSDWRPPG
jgi:predicted RNA-binding protein associated with RNAse of E/G family